MKNNTNANQTAPTNLGQLALISLTTDKEPELEVLHYFSYGKDYKVIPGRPSSFEELEQENFSSKDMSAIWIAYKKYALKSIPTADSIRFSVASAMKFNVKNDMIIIYAPEAVKVGRTTGIQIHNLTQIGFERDEKLYVPFADRESYYDEETGDLLTIW
ncbi:MAG: hypothetical protein IKN09_00710 [Clostridia bacterium]|nr:hypothetical protein [Clostridia bacterium]